MDRLQRDAINWADGHAQLATGAIRLDDGVHAFVGADDGIGRAGLDAQGAANAPLLVDDGHGARPFLTVRGTQTAWWLPGETRQSRNALLAARWALVDGRFTLGEGVGVALTVGVAATGALRLRQCIKQG